MWPFKRPKKILLVGGAGFIGARLCTALSDEAAFSVGVLDLKTGHDVKDGIPGKWDTLIFLACNQKQTQAAIKDNLEMYGAMDTYMRRRPKTHLIFLSSAAVYADTNVEHKETEDLNPSNPYGVAKVTGEYHAGRWPRHTILRLANVYGNGDGHGVIDRFIRGAQVIYGDGEQTRDFIDVKKVVEVIKRVIASPENFRGIYNVSTGLGLTVNEAFTSYASGKPLYKKAKAKEIRHSVLDSSALWEKMYG